MKVFQVAGYPKSFYFVKTLHEFREISNWMNQNNVEYLHEASCMHGYGFSIRKNFLWFMLKWV